MDGKSGKMGKTSYDKCVEILKDFKGQEMGLMNLQLLVRQHIGSDPRTVFNTLKLMSDMKLIKDIGNSHFKIL